MNFTMKPDFTQLRDILNQNLGVHKNNCETVIDFTLSLHKARTVNLSIMSNYSMRIGNVKSLSIYKNFQRLVHDCKISQPDLAKCIITMFELQNCKLTLALDRTNWRYGKGDINLLVLSVCLLGCSIPLYWKELNSRGNSNTAERIALLDLFIADFGTKNIDYLLADREFIGGDWFTYLNKLGINFVIRIKSNMLMHNKSGEQVKCGQFFKLATRNQPLFEPIIIDGVCLAAEATRSFDNKLVVVVSNKVNANNLLITYKKRWRIECLFSSLKTRGFNFEDTHITDKVRIGNLTKLVVIAFAICYLIGLVRASVVPIIIKKHGYKQNSYFRYGFELLIQKLSKGISETIKLITICFSALTLEQKCKKLICVM